MIRCPHFIKKIYTRLKYGVSCCKAYSLYYYWAIQFKKEITGYKKIAGKYIDLDYEQFGDKIDKIIEALDLIIDDDYIMPDGEEQKKIDEGLKLFAENFERFWY